MSKKLIRQWQRKIHTKGHDSPCSRLRVLLHHLYSHSTAVKRPEVRRKVYRLIAVRSLACHSRKSPGYLASNLLMFNDNMEMINVGVVHDGACLRCVG